MTARALGIACLLLLGACSLTSTRLASWYVTRQIDGYLDLTSEQKARVRPHVDAEVDRARREDLPHWLSLLRRVRDLTLRGPSDATVLAAQQLYDQLLNAGVERLAPQFAPLLSELDAEQLTHFQKELLAFVDKTLPEQPLPPEERLEEQDERVIEATEKITGDLDAAQEQKLLSHIHDTPDDRPLRYQNDRKRAFAFIKFLRAKPEPAAVEAELKRLWHTRFAALGPGFDLVSRRATQRKQILALDALLTAKQRAHAVEHLNDQIVMVKRWLLPAQ